MKRKDFVKWLAAAGGVALLPSAGKGAGFEELRQAAPLADEAFWNMVRGQFLLDPAWTFLNFGGLGACPLPVMNYLADAMRAEELAPSAGYDDKQWNAVKESLAALLGKSCKPEELALISGASEGVNLIVNGLPLRKGDEVITSSHEHICVNAALLNRRRRSGIVIRRFEPDMENGPGNVERIERLMNKRTRLILISHVTCTTGQRFPEREIARLARERKVWFALDGAQGPVNVPMDIHECGADFYVASTHKWIMSPKRTGFLHVRPGMLETLAPTTVGGGGVQSFDMNKGELTFAPSAKRFEYGTQNDALFYGLYKAIEFIQVIGVERILRHCRPMAEAFYQGLLRIPGVEVLSPREKAYRTQMIGFRVNGVDYQKVVTLFADQKIRVRGVSEGGLNSVRVSFFLPNRMSEVEMALEHLKKLAG